MDPLIDIVTVYHNDEAYVDHIMLDECLDTFEEGRYNLIGIDNREDNRGFAKACNLGATLGNAPVIGFINPDATIYGSFIDKVYRILSLPNVVVTGCNFGKPASEYRDIWGCEQWVCGAAFFVRRDWFEKLGGFDEAYVWSWEETDFIRRTYEYGKLVIPVELNIQHMSPDEDSIEDSEYKKYHFNRGAQIFRQRWQ